MDNLIVQKEEEVPQVAGWSLRTHSTDVESTDRVSPRFCMSNR